MLVSILHVSDLHRDPGNPITNAALVNSMLRDLERCKVEDPPIRPPDLVFVSGDIIQGVPADAATPDKALADQYEQAFQFLTQLADEIVGGDRQRVVIVPGNHDVSFPHTMRSLKEVTLDPALPGAHSTLVKAVFSPGSTIRWSWNSLSFYDIDDPAAYNSRLSAFCDFYDRFYAGTRRYSLRPEEQFDIFEFPAFNLLIVAFNSCYNNDPLNKRGAIHPDCLAEAARQSRQRKYRHRLRFAMWHHSTSGGPAASDYMDATTLQGLIDYGFYVGFHGHQHKPQFVDETYQFGSDRKITVVCTGTMCGGANALPPGHARAYNIFLIDTDKYTATLHQRRMQNEDFRSPIWGQGVFPVTGRSWIDISVQTPPKSDMKAAMLADLSEAEELIRSHSYEPAISLLTPLTTDSPLARRLLLEALVNSDDSASAIIKHFNPPLTTIEAIHVADALWEEGRREDLQKLLTSDIIAASTDPSVVQIRNKYEARVNR